ncbi:MAG: thioredoxin-disulfide reductase [Firmicutes bacterium]|nr:thioredoxin-disulfide reductase [Bacillota bacterium]
MSNAKIYDTVIIGGGPAGYSAALYAVRAGLSSLLIEKLAPGGQLATTTEVENYPGIASIDGWSLAQAMAEQAVAGGAEQLFDEVTELQAQSQIKLIRTAGGEELQARTVIYAAGAEPKLLGLPKEQEWRGRGVSYCATCDGMFYRGRTVAVAGGGNSAAEEALHLSKICEKVYLIHRRDTLRAEMPLQQKLAQTANIEIIYDTAIEALLGESKLSALQLLDKKSGHSYELPIDGLFVAIGRTPISALLQHQAQLDADGYVLAGEDCRTMTPGLFVAGDVRRKPLRQIVTAAADGAVAATAAAAAVWQ